LDLKDFLNRKIKRLYDEINYAQQRGDYSAAEGFLPWLGQILYFARLEYSENKFLNDLTVPPPGYFDNPLSASANLTTIKLQLLNIMDLLGIDFETIKRVESFVPTVFNISQSQNSMQVNSQSVENIISLANNLSVSPQEREEILQLLDEYKKETESKTTNEGKVKSILSKAFKISKEIGVPLFTHAVQSGYLSDLFGQ